MQKDSKAVLCRRYLCTKEAKYLGYFVLQSGKAGSDLRLFEGNDPIHRIHPIPSYPILSYPILSHLIHLYPSSDFPSSLLPVSISPFLSSPPSSHFNHFYFDYSIFISPVTIHDCTILTTDVHFIRMPCIKVVVI